MPPLDEATTVAAPAADAGVGPRTDERRRPRLRESLLLKLALFVAAVVILTAGAVGHLAYVLSRAMLHENIHDRLRLVAAERASRLESFASLQLERALLISTRTRLSQLVDEHAAGSIAADRMAEEAGRILNDARRSGPGLVAVRLLDADGRVTASTRDGEIGRSFAEEPAFAAGRSAPHLEGPRFVGGDATVTAGAPIGGTRRPGVVLLEADARPLLDLLRHREGLPATGTILVGRPAGDAFEYLVPTAEGETGIAAAEAPSLAEAVAGRTGAEVALFDGVEVLAAFRPVRYESSDAAPWGLVAQVDLADAYAPVANLRRLLLASQAVLLALGVAAAYCVARRFARPVLHLADVASHVAAGDLAARAPVASRDEIGVLAAAFNRMTGQLQESRDTLESRVHDRTIELIESEKQLRRQTRILRSMLDSLGDGVIVADQAGRFLLWNPAAEQIVGIGPREVEPGEWSQFYGCFLPDGVTECPVDRLPLVRAMRGEVVDGVELCMRNSGRPDGAWISVNARPLRNDTGELRGGVVVIRDVTEMKRAQQELAARDAQNRAILETTHEAFVAMGENGAIREWNGRAQATFGWTRDEVLGRELADVVVPERFRAAHRAGLARFLAAGEGPVLNRRLELSALHRDGHEFPIEITIAAIRDGDGHLFGAFLHDVSDQHAAQEDLRRAMRTAEEASRAKSAFLANMSHEIRTPMNGILGMTELVLDSDLSPRQREYLEIVQESAESLLAVINEILDFSKIEAGRFELEPEPFDLREHIEDTVRSLALRAHRKGLELACHIGPDVPRYLVGDRQRLRQIVVNLIGNAVKFTDRGEIVVDVSRASEPPVEQGESPSVDLAPTDRDPIGGPVPGGAAATASPESPPHPAPDDVLLHFAVRDTGIGIPQDKQGIVFEPFEQVDESPTRRFGGTGLGLAICARLVETMQGRIWVDSRPGHGSTFHFTARFAPSAVVPRAPDEGTAERLHGLRVLVVDDNPTNVEILVEMLRQLRMDATGTASARAALDLLHARKLSGDRFDLVLIDAGMPDMDGYSLARAIRRDDDVRSALLMMLSSGDRPGSAPEDSGIAACLTKPVKQSELLDAVARVVGAGRTVVEAPPSPRGREFAARVRPLDVLLVEDSPVNRKLATALLEPHGHRVSAAGDGREALAALESRAFDLVLMDVQMPVLDGLEATREIRRREAGTGRHVPIVAMTAHALKGDRERCLAAGMDGYVSKPVRAAELYAAVETLLARDQRAAGLPPIAAAEHVSGANTAGDGVLPSGQEVEGTTCRDGSPASHDPPASLVDGDGRPAVAEIDILDWDAALARTGLEPQSMRGLAELYFEQEPLLRTEARAALAARDAPTLRRAAHTLKGSVAVFQARLASEAAQRLETLAKDERFDEAPQALAELESELDRLRPHLVDRIRAPESASA